ncbi:DivIVA domain repeat protein [Bifidobacterium thermophilum]|uniref:DivIVA domain repeat protein n=1 Tax=Bifidobacterium thermophilum TaxID=33905 RepID=A0A2N3QMV0_9BIFI|nr:DivIVA domain-containing protein [Bifidobacterium thermophilum]PKU90382.1 DivIVA domain repeat protein [Bifidobacterium thermophilum]PKU93009.1 DivIVA domain repeat protein [Bifidobacterium thermophilum]
MAKKPETEQGASGIALVGKRKWGYDVPQVDEFLERAHKLYDSEGMQLTQKDIQNVSFEMRKGGYAIAQVDAALARLERAVVDKQTTWEITQHGRVAWKAQTEDLYRQIAGHAQRPQRKRFAAGEGKQPSYDRKQVDRLVDQVVDKAAAELGIDGADQDQSKKDIDLNAQRVANVIFTQRRGKHGYDERQVDYYINACVQLLSRIESYARVADYVGSPEEQSAQPHANGGVKPLFAQQEEAALPQFAPGSGAAAYAAAATPQSFDALHEAEQAIFVPSQSDQPAFGAGTPAASTSPVSAGTPQHTSADSANSVFSGAGADYLPAFGVPSSGNAGVGQPTAAQQLDASLFGAAQSPVSQAAASANAQGSPSLAALASSNQSTIFPNMGSQVTPVQADTPASAGTDSPVSVPPSFQPSPLFNGQSVPPVADFNQPAANQSSDLFAAAAAGPAPAALSASAPASIFPAGNDSVSGNGSVDASVFGAAASAGAPSDAPAHDFSAGIQSQPVSMPSAFSAASVQTPATPVTPMTPATPATPASAAAPSASSFGAPNADAQAATAAAPSVNLFPDASDDDSHSNTSASGYGFDIPDLSFPSLGDDHQQGRDKD